MSPAEATAFVERAVAAGILRPSAGDGLELSFDPDLAPAALGFRPDPRAVAANAPAGRPDVFLDHLALLQRATGLDRKACMDRVAARQAEAGGMLSATAAVLWLCAEAKVDVRHAAGQVKP